MDDLPKRLAQALATRYTIERELGHGGTAFVYLAHDLKLHRSVAIKVLRPDVAAALGAERFLREIEIAARLSHPHILPLFEPGEADGLLYYSMPYVEGESLRQRLAREGRLPLDDAIRITTQVAGALRYAHDHGVVHRDIKPGNILLAGEEVVIADFGIAHAITEASGDTLTSRGIALGTPAYMSPEQGSGETEVDGRSDVFSLGCVTYEMLTGTVPFAGATAREIQARKLSGAVPPIRTVREEVPPHVEQAVLGALVTDPSDRFATATVFADALTSSPVIPASSRRHPTVALVAVGLVAAALGVMRWSVRLRTSVPPSASVIAVIPFTPSQPDTALSRLGRDLTFTISAALDGVGEIRTVDPHTLMLQSEITSARHSVEDATKVGRRLGAGSVLYGSLVREGRSVRLDLELLQAIGATPVARVTITNALDSTAALTDSACWRLLRQIWQRGDPPTPSLAALTTRSVAALRAFLEGEHAMTEGRWHDAENAFARAIDADSTFWLAYWRHMYARNFQGQPEDAAPYRALWQHRTQVHGVDSLLLEADQGPGAGKANVAHALLEEATRRYPYNWWAWFTLADLLVHQGPRLGYGINDGRAALERTLVLNPKLAEGWAHLLMVTVGQDSSASRHAFEELRQLSPDSGRVRWERLFYDLDRNGGQLDTALADSVERDVGGPTLIAPEISVRFLEHGFSIAQLAYDDRVLRRGVSLSAASAFRLSVGRSWAARGAWDSALTAADEYSARAERDTAALEGYRLAVLGAWMGALDHAAAQQRGRALAALAEHFPPVALAERAWLDGMLAVTLQDRVALAAARAALAASGDSVWQVLDRSLAAFGIALAGARGTAADSLASIEWQRLDPSPGPYTQRLGGIRSHPFLTGVNRFAAATWLLQKGDTTQAARLLTWHEIRVWFPEPIAANAVLAGPAYLQLARIEQARGHPDLARRYYRQFLSRYDRPVPSLRHLVEEAKTELARLPA